jgi:hypothetical protein
MLHPPHRWGKGATAVLVGYVDGSGTHASSEVVVVSGFIAEENEWLELDRKWNAILDDPRWPSRLSEFHMVDCVHGDREFLEGAWSFAQRLSLYGDLCVLLRNSNVTPIGAAAVAEAFHQIPASDLALLRDEQTRLGTPLDVCFQMLVQQTVRRVHERDESIAIIFDNEDRATEIAFSDFCHHYHFSFPLGDVFSGFGFADSRQLTALQAADLLAFGTLHLAQHMGPNPPRIEPYFPVIPAFWNMLVQLASSPNTSPYGQIVGLEDLKALVEKVKKGDMLPKKQELPQ